jgi:hypothetical protein
LAAAFRDPAGREVRGRGAAGEQSMNRVSGRKIFRTNFNFKFMEKISFKNYKTYTTLQKTRYKNLSDHLGQNFRI